MIPQSGRIGRFAKVVAKNTSEEIYLNVMKDSETYAKLKPEKKANWWKQAVERLEDEAGTDKAIEMMRQCGSKCCGAGLRKTAKRLMNESNTVEEFLEKLSLYQVKEGELEYRLIDNSTIIGKHNRCFCGQVKKAQEHFRNDIYCQCSVEFNKQFFQAAFQKPVEVSLKQSLLTGGDCCEFEIKIS